MKWLFIASGYSAGSNLSGDKDYAKIKLDISVNMIIYHFPEPEWTLLSK